MIASDKAGETLAFGTTVPLVTTSTPADKLHEDVAYLVGRLVADHIEFAKTCADDGAGTPTLAIPVPVQPRSHDHITALQRKALQTVTAVMEQLDQHAFVVLSCTPVAMTDSHLGHDDLPEGVLVGYMILASTALNGDDIMADSGPHPVASVWTERADRIYGDSAVQRAKEQASASLESILSQITGQGPTVQ